MNILEAVINNSNMQYLKDILVKQIKEYDDSVELYKSLVLSYAAIGSKSDMTDLMNEIEEANEVKESLQGVISSLNKIQIVFEKLNYTVDSSSTEDVDEFSFIKQLENFSTQSLKLIEEYERERFTSYVNELYYITSLAEVHYSTKFGKLEENIVITEETEDKLKETSEYLDSLPKIETSDLS